MRNYSIDKEQLYERIALLQRLIRCNAPQVCLANAALSILRVIVPGDLLFFLWKRRLYYALIDLKARLNYRFRWRRHVRQLRQRLEEETSKREAFQ